MSGSSARFSEIAYSIYGVLLFALGGALFLLDQLVVLMPLASALLLLFAAWTGAGVALLLGRENARSLALSSALLFVGMAVAWIAAIYDIVPVYVQEDRLIEPIRTAFIGLTTGLCIALPLWFFFLLGGRVPEGLDEPTLHPLIFSVSAAFVLVALVLGLPAPFFTGWLYGVEALVVFGSLAIVLAAAAFRRWHRTGFIGLFVGFLATAISLSLEGVSGDVQLVPVFQTPTVVGLLVSAFLLYRSHKRIKASASLA